MIYLICRALFMLVVLEDMHAVHGNHVRHHHNLASYHHGHNNHHHDNQHHKTVGQHQTKASYSFDDYDNDYFDSNVKSDNEQVEELNDDDEYAEYMNDLENQQEEIAVGNSPTDFYDYMDNDKDTIYKPPDVSDDYQSDEGSKQTNSNRFKGTEEQQEAQRFPRKVRSKMSLDSIQSIRTYMNKPSYDYQNDDYQDPKKINDQKRALETFSGVQRNFERRRNQVIQPEINNYIRYIENEWRCYKPRAKLIPVVSDKPNSRLLPHCVVLHRCGSDTGCCNITHSCLPLKTELVNIPFYEERLAGEGDKATTVLQMQFLNHTECGCQRGRQCVCPSNFEAIQTHSSCTCECLRQNTKCLNQRNGITAFSMGDIGCIQQGFCKVPKCTYGNYSKPKGQCPSQLDY
ncbi:hypothetical protein ACFFRR_003959 [Megaselia abdita]